MLTINNTLDGYLKDVEIKGNTVQDPDNLADIRSVGDKVEGQELYEIPVLSCGKNLLKFDDNIVEVDGITFIFKDNKILLKGTPTASSVSSPLIPIKNLVHGKSYRLSLYGGDSKTLASLRYVNGEGKTVWGSNLVWNSSYRDCVVYVDVRSKDASVDGYELGLQLEESTQATPYEPYIEDKLTILSPVKLEKGDILYEDGTIVKVIKDLIFNGSENWTIRNDLSNDTLSTFELREVSTINQFAICNLFNVSNSHSENELVRLVPSNGVIVVNINNSRLESNDAIGFKKFLSVNNLLLKVNSEPTKYKLPHDQQVKLRTFAGKTNISFLTEIEGTIKAQVPKSLGATVNTHTEQINNLNKELNRVKKLEESTVSTVITESDFTTVEATSNGYFEDVKLEGKTLVNLATQPTNNGSINHQYATISTVTNIKPSTEYTYIIRNNGSETLKLYLNNNGGFDWFDLDVEANSTVIGKARTLPTIEGDIWLSLKKAETVAQNIKVVLLEGDHTQNPPSYFEGLKSVGQDVDEVSVGSFGVCMFDDISNPHHTKTIYPLGSNGIYWNEFKQYLTHFNNVSNYENCNNLYDYYYTSDNNSIWVNLGSFDKAKALINLNYKISEINNKADKKRLLYYNEETQTWEKPILRQWDSIEKHANGKYYYHQRSGEVVLNGSENWVDVTSTDELSGTDLYSTFKNTKLNSVNGIFDKFLLVNSNIGFKSYVGECCFINNYGTTFKILKSKLSTQDVAGFKQWLQTNNVTVVYQLAKEKVYECTNIDLITYANETNFIIESGVLSPKTTLKVHSNISNVVSLLQKKVSLLESNMTKYMITQNRLQLSSTYSADSVTFKVDYTVCSENMSQENYDTDLYNLILNNILVGKDNYDYDHMFNIIMDYASWSQISWDQFDILVGLMDIQHNPPIEEIPTDDEIVEEIPSEIM